MAEAKQEEHALTDAMLLLHIDGLRRGVGLSRQVRQFLLRLQATLRKHILLYDPNILLYYPTQAPQRRQQVGLLTLLLATLTEAIGMTYREIEILMETATLDLAVEHAVQVTQLLQATSHAIRFDPVSARAELAMALRTTSFPSAVMGAMPTAFAPVWWQRQGMALTQRMQDQLRAGVLAGESGTVLARRVTGTPSLQRKDGLMAQALRTAEMVAEAQTAMALTQAKEVVVQVHSEQIAYLRHDATMDERTSAICRERDGKRFDPVTYAPIGHNLQYLSGPPYHPRCRSIIAVVLKEGLL
jgi:SPP1 gp7 family putative phage head morphogenesis protein